MDDINFLNRIQDKIERATGKSIELLIDEENSNSLEVELEDSIPRLIFGHAVLQYPGFARLCIEYSVACIREGRQISTLEFHAVLGRN
ncbi:hypothetical protein FIM04_01365 [SAR202 cluster bacterium AC-409-J13_OGT_754m]|nr:hypothetical protein [SAR202 cluster bacterium AC-409-J13_OGT_754m]